MSYEAVRVQHLLSFTINNSDRDLTSLPSVTVSTPASRDEPQQVSAAPKDRQLSSSSQKSDQQDSRPINIPNLLNPEKCGDRLNASGALSSLSLPRIKMDLLVSSRPNTHNLCLAKPSSYPQISQETPYPQVQKCKRPRDVNLKPRQPASQGDSQNTQYSSYNRVNQTESTPPMLFTAQPQYFPSSSSASPSPTIPQMPPGTKAFEVSTSSTAKQIQYQIMLETEKGPIQVPIDMQMASKVQDEKRRRNATNSHRFRQRQKEKEQETYNTTAKLETQIREMEEDRDHYHSERDHFRDLALRHYLPVAPRPPSPKRQRHAVKGGALPAQH